MILVVQNTNHLCLRSSGLNERIDSLKKKSGLTPKKSTTGTSHPAYTEKREGKGVVKGIVIFGDDTAKKGFDINTPSKDFFEGALTPKMLDAEDEITIKVYKKIPGQRELVRLTEDIDVVGPRFEIKNMPFNTDIIVKVYTAYGNPNHTYEPLGRPKGYVHLTKENPFEYVVIPIKTQEGINYKIQDRPEELEHAFLDNIIVDDAEQTDIIVNSAHSAYKISKRNGDKTEYVQVLLSIVYAMASKIEDKDSRLKMYKEMLATIDKRKS